MGTKAAGSCFHFGNSSKTDFGDEALTQRRGGLNGGNCEPMESQVPPVDFLWKAKSRLTTGSPQDPPALPQARPAAGNRCAVPTVTRLVRAISIGLISSTMTNSAGAFLAAFTDRTAEFFGSRTKQGLLSALRPCCLHGLEGPFELLADLVMISGCFGRLVTCLSLIQRSQIGKPHLKSSRARRSVLPTRLMVP